MNFRLLGIPVTIHPSYWIFLGYAAFVYGSLDSLLWEGLGALTFSILFHEYGHALTALAFGQRPSVHLIAFGGYASFNGIGLSRKQQYWITLNGPLATLFLVIVSYNLLHQGTFWGLLLRSNLFLLLANLCPLYPLDGGRLLRHALESRWGTEQGTRLSLLIGHVAALVGCIYFFATDNYIFGSLFVFHGLNNWQVYQEAVRAQVKMTPHVLYQEGMKAMVGDDMVRAKLLFRRLLKQADKQLQTAAAEGLATVLEKEGGTKEAYHLLLKADPTYLKRGKWLLCKLAYTQGNFSLIDTYARDIYEIHPAFETALLISQAYAQLKRPEESGGWFHTASLFEDAPKEKLREILADPLYDGVRAGPYAQKVASLLSSSS